MIAQLFDAFHRLLHPLLALELEGLGDCAHGESPDLLLGDLGDHRSRTGSGASALTRGDENHVGALESLLNLVAGLGCRAGTDFGTTTGTEAAGQLLPDRNLDVGVTGLQRLGVGVDGDELDAAYSCVDHTAHRIGTAAAAADDLDYRQVCGLHLSDPNLLLELKPPEIAACRPASGLPRLPELRKLRST